MAEFRLHDWNDIKLLLACAELGSFARAASSLQIQQSTVSRRIGQLEIAAGRPLFHRERSGATPTPAGLELLTAAYQLREKKVLFEQRLMSLRELPPQTVTVSASDGLVAYTLAPFFGGDRSHYLALDRADLREPPPPVEFTNYGGAADIAILGTNPGEVPVVPSTHRVRRIGTMSLAPVAGRAFARRRSAPTRFDDLQGIPLVDNRFYRHFRGLDDWNAVVGEHKEQPVETVTTTPAMHHPLLVGRGVTILPVYSTLYDRRLVLVDVPTPKLVVPLWLSAHADRLREPSVRRMFDSLGTLFHNSSWFRQ